MRLQKTSVMRFIVSASVFISVHSSWADNVTTPSTLPLNPQQIAKLQQIFPSGSVKNGLSADEEPQHFTWQGDPIRIELPLNQEKRLLFPEKVLADLKGALTTEQLQIFNDNQSLYLTALKPFDRTRLFVTLQNSHDVLLIDVMTSTKASPITASIAVKTPSLHQENPVVTTTPLQNPTDNNPPETTVSPAADADTFVALTRFAWQQLYAPQRLLTHPLGLTRTPMHTLNLLSTLVYGDKVYAHPLASWQYEGTFITAVELRNKYPHATTIDVKRDLCGDWLAATLYPRRRLKAAGEKSGDNTMVFLLSQQSFSDSLAVCNGRA